MMSGRDAKKAIKYFDDAIQRLVPGIIYESFDTAC